jgi:hypothetical protein
MKHTKHPCDYDLPFRKGSRPFPNPPAGTLYITKADKQWNSILSYMFNGNHWYFIGDLRPMLRPDSPKKEVKKTLRELNKIAAPSHFYDKNGKHFK